MSSWLDPNFSVNFQNFSEAIFSSFPARIHPRPAEVFRRSLPSRGPLTLRCQILQGAGWSQLYRQAEQAGLGLLGGRPWW